MHFPRMGTQHNRYYISGEAEAYALFPHPLCSYLCLYTTAATVKESKLKLSHEIGETFKGFDFLEERYVFVFNFRSYFFQYSSFLFPAFFLRSFFAKRIKASVGFVSVFDSHSLRKWEIQSE